jgi:hypothetical protein
MVKGSSKTRVGVLIKAGFRMGLDMARVEWSLKVGLGMKALFRRIRLQVEECTSMRMGLGMKVILRMESAVVMGSCSILIKMSTEVTGKTISVVEWAHFIKRKCLCTKVILRMISPRN